MSYILIPRGDGYISHSNVDPDKINLPDDAEIYDGREAFEGRLEDFGQS